ncbi:sigma-70 family RNA polymerase sigma factor [Streptomyces sp. 6N223]|uniref:sigma-70 family RNA polymerase sigma factor n=1 Tax=Streptomyces sp. 6N223 TaxID=3457412 RepID=UPI003FD1D448
MGHETPPHWDREMRDRLRNGEAAALAELYDRFASLAYGIAQRVLGDEDATGQVTGEVFARIWEAPEDFDPEQGPMRSWIAAEAHRRAVDRLRALIEAAADLAADPAPPAAGAVDGVRSAATAARADYIFTAMPTPLRDALRLARFEQHDYRRMARELGITEAEACRRLRLGLQLLSSAAEYPMGTAREER